MINRILIRIKVVQILYSYLLTKSEFKIFPVPEKKSRDNLYAYSVYIDLLRLIMKFSGYRAAVKDTVEINANGLKKPFVAVEVGKALSQSGELREYIYKNELNLDNYAEVIQPLFNEICASAVYQDYAKKRAKKIEDEVRMWIVVIQTILAKSDIFKAACRRSSDFTIVGFERGLAMAVETLADYRSVKTAVVNARKSLERSFDEAYRLYIALLMLPSEITRLQQERIDTAREKFLPTAEDLNPNLKLVNNYYVETLRNTRALEKEFTSPILSDTNESYLVKKLLDDILASQIYADYIAKPENNPADDCEFWRTVMRDIILPSDSLAEALESKSIYWNDDLHIVGQFVLKTIRRTGASDDSEVTLMPMFKDEEDEAFGNKLLTYAMDNGKEYRELIDRFVNQEQWDSERVALMDIVILEVAIAEMLNFQQIPLPVTLNEFIEIANFYSTSRSGQFVNGILYSVINYLKSEGRLLKAFQ